jgi:GYF domain 2
MAKWFYLTAGQQSGPVEPAELKRLATTGHFQPTDKVRREDLAEWYEAKQVKGLFPAIQSQASYSFTAATRTASDGVSVSEAAASNAIERRSNAPPLPVRADSPGAAIPNERKTVAIQQTAKRWNALRFIGIVLCILGLCTGTYFFTLRPSDFNTRLAALGFVLSGLGFVTYLIGGIVACWQHRYETGVQSEKVFLAVLGLLIIAVVYICWPTDGSRRAESDVALERTLPQESQAAVAIEHDLPKRTDLAVGAPSEAPPYTIVKSEDLSMGRVRRLQIRVSVPEQYSRDVIDQVARAIVADVSASQPVNAISILFYGPGASTAGPFDIAMVEWAPHGRWGDAYQVEAGEYSTFAYSIEYQEPTLHPARGLEASGMKGLLGAPLPAGSRLLEKRPGDPASGRDPSERYAISASATEISAFFIKEMPAAGWAKDGSSKNTALFYQKGNVMIGVLINGAGGTFTLMGS